MKSEVENENQELEELVTKWTGHMKWRSDYKQWVIGRIWQEERQKARIGELVEIFGDISGKKILDLGCGMGGAIVALLKDGYDVTGLDFNRDYCEITKLRGRRYGINVRVVNSVGEFLPFKDEQFDLITCFDVLEHVKNPKQVLSEINRVLKPKGKAIVIVINKYSFKDPHYHLRFINWIPKNVAEWYIKMRGHAKDNPLFKDTQKLSEMHYFTVNEFKEISENIGFHVDIKDSNLWKIDNPSEIENFKIRKCVNILKFFKMGKPVYTFLHHFYLSTFKVILTKNN